MRLPFVLRDRDAQSNFDKLATSLPFNRARTGSATLTFTASTDSGNVTVAHGLGAIPTAILVTSSQAGLAKANYVALNASNEDSTSFLVAGRAITAFTGTVRVFWLAFA